MNKRITSLLLCFVMVFSLLFTALPVFAVPGKTTTLTARPDKATASPGETITYTVTLGAVEDLLGIKFKLIIPEGLTFVTGAERSIGRNIRRIYAFYKSLSCRSRIHRHIGFRSDDI